MAPELETGHGGKQVKSRSREARLETISVRRHEIIKAWFKARSKVIVRKYFERRMNRVY